MKLSIGLQFIIITLLQTFVQSAPTTGSVPVNNTLSSDGPNTGAYSSVINTDQKQDVQKAEKKKDETHKTGKDSKEEKKGKSGDTNCDGPKDEKKRNHDCETGRKNHRNGTNDDKDEKNGKKKYIFRTNDDKDKENGDGEGHSGNGVNNGRNQTNTDGNKGRNQTNTDDNNKGYGSFGKGSKGTCKIAVIADSSFAKSYPNDPEQSIREIVSEASAYINAEFSIALSIESIDIKNEILAKGEKARTTFTEQSKKIDNYSELCFVLGLTSSVLDSPGIAGTSPVGDTCQGAVIVVTTAVNKEKSLETPILTLTHEIGHMLGAEHDDYGGCKAQGYVMASGRQREPEKNSNAVKFSKCSMDAITPRLGGYQCLY